MICAIFQTAFIKTNIIIRYVINTIIIIFLSFLLFLIKIASTMIHYLSILAKKLFTIYIFIILNQLIIIFIFNKTTILILVNVIII
jgi:hypothetical protein